MPRSVTKINRDGVEFTSNVDAIQYTIRELTRAALRDCGKLLRKRIIQKMKLLPGMKRSKRPYRATQYWARKIESDLQIGFAHNTWYSTLSELGSNSQPKRDILRSTVMENIDEMQKIQAQYLSAITTNSAESLINEDEYKSPEGEE